MSAHRREFYELRRSVSQMQGASYQMILQHLDALEETLGKVAKMNKQDPDFGRTLHDVGLQSDAVLQSVRQSGVRGIKIPQSLHTFRISLRQPDLVQQIASQLVA